MIEFETKKLCPMAISQPTATQLPFYQKLDRKHLRRTTVLHIHGHIHVKQKEKCQFFWFDKTENFYTTGKILYFRNMLPWRNVLDHVVCIDHRNPTYSPVRLKKHKTRRERSQTSVACDVNERDSGPDLNWLHHEIK